MATLQVTVSPEELLQIVTEMPSTELTLFTNKVLAEKARRTAPTLNSTEEALLAAIYAAQLPHAERVRLHELGAKVEAETLAAVEQEELAQLIDKSETLNAERLAKVSELATLWQKPLITVMKQLGLWQSYGE